jgi:hypothetical protein
MCMIDDESSWKIFRDATRRARKEHRCDECHRVIRVGEPYYWATGLSYEYDGWETYSTCQHCRAATEWLLTACHGYLFTMVLEDLLEHWHESPTYRSWTLGRLIVGMRRRWSDGDMPVPDIARVRAAVPRPEAAAA